MTVSELLSYASEAGLSALLLLILWGGSKRIWVWGWQYEEKVDEVREWKTIASRGTTAAATAVEVAASDLRRDG